MTQPYHSSQADRLDIEMHVWLSQFLEDGIIEERRVTSVLGEHGLQHCVLSRHWFERVVFEFRHGDNAQY